METDNKDTHKIDLGQNSLPSNLNERLAKIYRVAILRYNQAKSNLNTETANDDPTINSIAVLTPNAGKSSEEADC